MSLRKAVLISVFISIVQQFFPWQLSAVGASSVFMIYGLFALIGLVVLTIILPETKNKSIEEIDEALNGKPI